jgi:hypothetical protein
MSCPGLPLLWVPLTVLYKCAVSLHGSDSTNDNKSTPRIFRRHFRSQYISVTPRRVVASMVDGVRCQRLGYVDGSIGSDKLVGGGWEWE